MDSPHGVSGLALAYLFDFRELRDICGLFYGDDGVNCRSFLLRKTGHA
jgi:hypothetical protein